MTIAPPTRDRLLDDAIEWMAKEVDKARARAVGNAVAAPRRSPGERAQDRKKEGALRIPIDQRLAHEEGRRRFQTPTTQPEEDELAAIAVAICAEWRQPRASKLAAAWFNGKDADVEGLMNSDERTIAILVGIAAAAAVLAVVFLVRRGRTARIPPGRELALSPEFQALCSVAKGEGDAARVAAAVRDSVAEPWAWTAREGISKLALDDKRTLLEAFAAISACGVARVRPAKGDAFDERRMVTDVKTTQDDRWVVSAEVPARRVGFHLGDRLEIHARVDVCTMDWWVLSSPSCPVGRTIGERSDGLVAGGKTGPPRWRAPWGLAHPEDLRELFDETVLDAWRKRMVAELNPHYGDLPERCLSIIGAPGDVFESSIMEPAGAVPVGDAVVEDVARRQGERQYGLACPGGSALLLAVVRATAARREGA
jgi:hypothetical protein